MPGKTILYWAGKFLQALAIVRMLVHWVLLRHQEKELLLAMLVNIGIFFVGWLLAQPFLSEVKKSVKEKKQGPP